MISRDLQSTQKDAAVFLQQNQLAFFPEKRFVTSFFRSLFACVTPCISISIIPHIHSTYPVTTSHFNTYPTNTPSGAVHSIRPLYKRAGAIMNVCGQNKHQHASLHVSIPRASISYVSIQQVYISRNQNMIAKRPLTPTNTAFLLGWLSNCLFSGLQPQFRRLTTHKFSS